MLRAFFEVSAAVRVDENKVEGAARSRGAGGAAIGMSGEGATGSGAATVGAEDPIAASGGTIGAGARNRTGGVGAGNFSRVEANAALGTSATGGLITAAGG
jgi:hypothetical protein